MTEQETFREQLRNMHLQWHAEEATGSEGDPGSEPEPSGGGSASEDPERTKGGGEPSGGGKPEPSTPDEFPGYRPQLPANRRNDEVLKTAPRTVEGLVDAYAELVALKEKGSEPPARPAEGASDEEMAAYRKVMGIPESADKYNLTKPDFPEEMTEEVADTEKWFRETAFALDIPGEAAKALYDSYNKQLSERLKAYADKREAERIKTIETATEEFGESYEALSKKAQGLAVQIGGEEFKEFLNSTGAGDQPGLVLGMLRLAKRVGEDNFHPGDTTTTSTTRRKGVLRFPKSVPQG